MAVFSIADMGASMSTVYRRKISQTQRKTPTLRVLAALGALRPGNTGQAMTWTPKFSGQVAGNVSTDGGAFLTAASDQPVAASDVYGTIEAPGQVTDDMYQRARPSAGISAEYNTFADPDTEQTVDALEAALKLLNQQLYSGTGLTNQPTGLSTSVASSGIYASINAATYSQWASTVTVNGGSLRNLTIALMKTFLRTVSAASKAGRPNIGFCTGTIMDAIEALFDPYLQIPTPMEAMAAPGQKERMIVNPSTIKTVGGTINMDGFRVLYWQTGGTYFVEDPDVTNTAATNTAAGIFFLNTNELEMNYLPRIGARQSTPAEAVAAVEQDMGPIANLEFEKTWRARTKHANEFDINTKIGLKLLSRNAHGFLGDLQ